MREIWKIIAEKQQEEDRRKSLIKNIPGELINKNCPCGSLRKAKNCHCDEFKVKK